MICWLIKNGKKLIKLNLSLLLYSKLYDMQQIPKHYGLFKSDFK